MSCGPNSRKRRPNSRKHDPIRVQGLSKFEEAWRFPKLPLIIHFQQSLLSLKSQYNSQLVNLHSTRSKLKYLWILCKKVKKRPSYLWIFCQDRGKVDNSVSPPISKTQPLIIPNQVVRRQSFVTRAVSHTGYNVNFRSKQGCRHLPLRSFPILLKFSVSTFSQ